jgi:hypothetical protein
MREKREESVCVTVPLTFILLDVDILLHRHGQNSTTVRTQYRARLSEQQYAVCARLVKEYSLPLVEHKFLDCDGVGR